MNSSTLLAMAWKRLDPRQFPSHAERERHAAEILRWVRFGIDYLDREADYLLIERNAHRRVLLPAFPGPFTVMARPDLILLRTDHDGERYIEFVDYKTGKQRSDHVVPVLTRYVSRPLLKGVLPDPTTTRMQFTFLWLKEREATVIDLPLDFCETTWESITVTLSTLAAERDWPEQPSMLCNFCPYNGNACTAPARMGADPVRF